MGEQLYTILSALADTYRIALDGNPECAIVYAQFDSGEGSFEAGSALRASESYRVAVVMKEHDMELIRAVCAALKTGGWMLSAAAEYYIADRERYQFEINAKKWEVIQQ